MLGTWKKNRWGCGENKEQSKSCEPVTQLNQTH